MRDILKFDIFGSSYGNRSVLCIQTMEQVKVGALHFVLLKFL